MRVLRSTIIATIIMALLVTAFAATVTAGDKGKLAILQGNPSTRIDVCINGREKVSAMRFGKVARLELAAGKKMVRFRKASPGNCRGKLRASKKVWIYGGTNDTVVITKKQPNKVIHWDNVVPPPGGPQLPSVDGFFRHAADMGSMKFYFETKTLPFTVAEMTWTKGRDVYRQVGINPPGGPPQYTTTWIGRSPAYFPPEVVAGPLFKPVGAYGKYEWILIGTNRNHKLKLLRSNY
jgi:hypothetical protein